MTNQRRINRSQGTINDSQGTINDEQGVINEKSKVDFSLTGFGGFLVFLVTFVLGGAALYYGITSGQANLAATQTLTNYKLDELDRCAWSKYQFRADYQYGFCDGIRAAMKLINDYVEDRTY